VDQRDRIIGKKLALYGQYEDSFQELLLSLAIPGTVVVDVGANIGLHTIPLARRVGSDGQVIAFEPDPDNYRLLGRNIEVNGIKNVVAYQKGLSSESGSALLYQSLENRGGLSLCPENVATSTHQVDHVAVEIVVADDVLGNLERPISVVKIDVEGAEPLVLQGMKKILRRNPGINLLFEFWPRFIRSFNINPYEFLKQLEDDGFSLVVIDSTEVNRKTIQIEEIIAQGDASENALNVHAFRHT